MPKTPKSRGDYRLSISKAAVLQLKLRAVRETDAAGRLITWRSIAVKAVEQAAKENS